MDLLESQAPCQVSVPLNALYLQLYFAKSSASQMADYDTSVLIHTYMHVDTRREN